MATSRLFCDHKTGDPNAHANSDNIPFRPLRAHRAAPQPRFHWWLAGLPAASPCESKGRQICHPDSSSSHSLRICQGHFGGSA